MPQHHRIVGKSCSYSSLQNTGRPQLKLDKGLFITKKCNTVYIPEKDQIKLINYNPYAAIKAELSVGK